MSASRTNYMVGLVFGDVLKDDDVTQLSQQVRYLSTLCVTLRRKPTTCRLGHGGWVPHPPCTTLATKSTVHAYQSDDNLYNVKCGSIFFGLLCCVLSLLVVVVFVVVVVVVVKYSNNKMGIVDDDYDYYY